MQVPIAGHAVPASFNIAGNILYLNRIAEGEPHPEDIAEESFRYRIQPLASQIGSWSPVRESDFWREFVLAP